MRTLDLQTDKMIAHVDEGVGSIIFNQPEKRNAVSYAMWQAIPEIIRDFSSSDDVRVVVMSGSGDRAFVSGADISEFEKLRNTPEQIEIYDAATSASNKALRSLDKPLIAMIRGFCVGGGLAISLAADLRIAADDGQFGVPAAKLGLGYGYAGIKELMNIVGPSYAKEIFFTGQRFNAAEAEMMGLVNRVVPASELESTVDSYARTIADNAPLTVKAAKAAVNEGTKNSGERDLDRIAALVEACFNSDDYKEGRRAFMEKRPPRFQGH
ncbi:MAG: enoyl-CoA hydratase [Chloroflexota bacterium]|nr:enoyl-CoA hydratase [Chloroflexota bacterium]MQG37532.1 enoyl-CoA hydratase [SAR202 cluster bacterium]|tara:strand:- start:318 stop:1121 length:804 start_codon:yes stop_codon:yes gene_type:complete